MVDAQAQPKLRATIATRSTATLACVACCCEGRCTSYSLQQDLNVERERAGV